jgi:hypothetical protein
MFPHQDAGETNVFPPRVPLLPVTAPVTRTWPPGRETGLRPQPHCAQDTADAEGGARTHTPSRATDFESAASASSATSAGSVMVEARLADSGVIRLGSRHGDADGLV